MIDIEKLSQEFAFMRNALKDIADLLNENKISESTFRIGCLYNSCHNHAVSIGNLVPSKIVPVDEAKENSKVESING